jgi:hypothetical protein
MGQQAWLRQLVVFAGFLALTFWLRRFTYVLSSLDWDESLYLLMARSLLEGHLPYTVIYDNKPPGIYVLFALGQLAFGHSVTSVRILTCIAVAATCTGLEALGRELAPNRAWTGLLAGFLYTVYAVAIDPASNTELFFAPFSVVAILIVLSALRVGAISGRKALGAGLLAGVALQIKPLALIEFAGIGLWGAWTLWAERRSKAGPLFGKAWKKAAAFACGLLLPTVLVVGVFVLSGSLPEYLDANVRANRVLGSLLRPNPTEAVASFYHHALRFWPLWIGATLSVLAWMAVGRSNREPSETMAPALIWFACAAVAVGIVGGRYPHYFLQPLVPLSLIAASGAARITARASRKSTGLGLLVVLVLAAAILWRENEPVQRRYRAFVFTRESSGIPDAGDPVAAAARHIRAEAATGDRIYVADAQPVLYYLLDRPVPTRYAFPPFLADSTLNRVARVDAVRELCSILSTAPRFLVRAVPLGHQAFYRALDPLVDRFYELDAGYPRLWVFRLREGAADSLRKAVSDCAGGARRPAAASLDAAQARG